MNSERHIGVLNDNLLDIMELHKCKTFQQDSAPCHKAKVVMKWFEEKGVEVLKWPGKSPDLNPNENLWTIIKKKVSQTNPSSLEELKAAIKSVWSSDIDKNLCKNLSDSMPRRIENIIKSKGYQSKY